MIRSVILVFVLSLSILISAQEATEEPGNDFPTGQIALIKDNRIISYDFETGRQRQLWSSGYGDSLSISPDGQYLAYGIFDLGQRLNNNPDVIIQNLEDLTDRVVIDINRDGDVDFSPDGTQIVFSVLDDTGQGALYIADVDGENVRQITYSAGIDRRPQWSPDGSTIAFISNSASDDSGDFHLYTVRPDGNGRRRYTGEDDGSSNNNFPGSISWSPDGTQIAYVLDAKIYVIHVTTREIIQITADTYEAIAPSWSPDGQWIAFIYNYRSTKEVCVIKLDGSAFECFGRLGYHINWIPQPEEPSEDE